MVLVHCNLSYFESTLFEGSSKKLHFIRKNLCKNARPREVVVKWNPAIQDYRLYVQLTKFIGDAANMSPDALENLTTDEKKKTPYILYTVPLSKLEQGLGKLSFNSFLTMPKEYQQQINTFVNSQNGIPNPNHHNYNHKAYENFVMVVNYNMNDVSSVRTKILEKQVEYCLDNKPWEDFKFIPDSVINTQSNN